MRGLHHTGPAPSPRPGRGAATAAWHTAPGAAADAVCSIVAGDIPTAAPRVGELTGKVALVTGGGAGIGRATAVAFARAGAQVVVGNRNIERGQETVALIRDAGGEASFKQTDVARAADVEALIAHAVEKYGALHCAFNNAGTAASLSTLAEESEDDYDRVMATNAKGVWLALKYEIRQMLKTGGGAIVNNASVAGLVGTASGNASYVASKHAVIGLTRAAALENARRGIRVNAVAPAIIETDMGGSYAAALKITLEEFGKKHPIGRVGQPPEVAAAVVWLCSDQASFVTGHCLTVDGGFTAQ